MLEDTGAELADLSADLRRIEPHLVILAAVRPDLARELQLFDRTLQRIDALSALMRIAAGEAPDPALPVCEEWLRNLRLDVVARRFGVGGAETFMDGADLF